LTILQGLGLTASLQLCLDAGDALSYSSGQSWLDRSGGGHDFFRGADGSATTTDPNFNGSPGGASRTEYFTFDGGDYFTYDTTNAAWMNRLHKDNAAFTIAMWVHLSSVSSIRVFGTAAATTEVGIYWGTTAGGLLNHVVVNGSGTAARSFNGGTAVPTDEWAFLAWSLNEATGANGASSYVNGAETLATSTYTSPSASDATYSTKIGANGSVSGRLPSGSRMAAAIAWEGVALSKAQLDSIYSATRGRFGV
jgi:hypothetical protein